MNEPKLQLLSDGKTFKFLEPWDYKMPDGEIITITAFTKSDLTSTPPIFRWFLPITGSHVFAALIHDYFIKYEKNWVKANDYCIKILKASKVPFLRKWFFIIFIELWRIFIKRQYKK